MKTTSNSVYLLAKKHVIRRKQFILYAIIGVSGVAIDYIAYSLGVQVFGLGLLLANFISVSLGIINNFALNVRFNFKTYDKLWTRFGIFYSVGFLGLLFSDLLLIIFNNGFKFSPLIAKLLTLPFVLVAQYVINKAVSFGDMDRTSRIFKRILKHWPAYLVVTLFGFCSISLVAHIPSDFQSYSLARAPAYAPDEAVHYKYNVAFILKNKRLPVSGMDDLSAYKSCSPDHLVKVHCGYSYVVFPGISYVISAASASILHHLFNVPYVMGARVPSTIYGIVFILCAYFAAYIITRRRLVSTLLAAGVGLIPEYIFTSSYTNLDAHSVAISGVVGLAFVNYLVHPNRKWSLPILGIVTAGLLPLAKYNFFILGLPVIATVAYMLVKKKVSRRKFLELIGWSGIGFIVFSSFWYVRNAVLYHDVLGQNFVLNTMSRYYPLGQPMNISSHTLVVFNELDFFGTLYRSFYYAFGSMFYYLGSAVYLVPAVFMVLGFVLLISRLAEDNKRLRPVIFAFAAFIAVIVLTLAEIIYNSMVYDFQPQGRYLYPILMPTVLFLAYCAKKDKGLEKLSLFLVTGTIFIFICGMGLAIKLYFNV